MRMKQRMLVFLFVLASAGLAFGQMIPTGKLTGTVTDGEKAALPGVSITISSPGMILPELAAVTNEKGLFKFFSLPSGSYKVVFALQGFKTIVREGIIIGAGQTVTLDVALPQGEINETVEVVGQSPTVDLEKTQTGTTYTKDLLKALPLQRDLSAIFNAAPGMFARTSHGSDARSNNFVVDGVKMQDPVTGDPYQTVPWNAIDEVEIETSNQKAEYGAVKGALVQVITRAGGNNFSGGVNFYFRNKSLQSDNTKGTPLEGTYVGFKQEIIPGFSFGGPIKKDKVWFFTSLDVDLNASYIQGFPAPAVYGDPQPASVPGNQNTYSPFAKVTWQLDQKDKIVASGYWRGYTWDHRDASRWTVLDANTREDSAVTIGTVQWSRTFSNSFLFNLKGSWYALHQNLIARNQLAPLTDYGTDGINRGGYGSSWWYTRRRLQMNSDATYFADNMLGSHEFKAGVDSEFAFDGTEDQYYSDPRFDGVFPAGFKAVDVQLVNGVPYWVWVGTEYRQKNNLIQVGGFLQDTWSPTKRLTINLGLRYDFAQGNYPPQRDKATGAWINQETIHAMSFNMLSPRIGVSFDPIGDAKTVIKANFGRYYSPLLMIFYYFNNPNQRTSFWARLNPDYSVAYTTPPWAPSQNTVDPGITAPYANEFNFGVEREIIEDFSVSATFIAKWEKNLIDDVEWGHLDWNAFKQSGELIWNGYHPVVGSDPFTGQPTTFYEMNADYGNSSFIYTNVPLGRKYKGLELKLTKRMSRRWAMQTSYVWSRGVGILNTSRDQSTGFSGYYDDPNVMINAYGRLDYQREHLVKVEGTYVAPFGINISAFYQFGSGIPYSRYLRDLEAGIGTLYQGDVQLIVDGRGAYKLPDQHLLDMRVEKTFSLGKGQIGLQFDVYNVFNNNRTTGIGNLTNWDWTRDTNGTNHQQIYSIMTPRYAQLGLVYRF